MITAKDKKNTRILLSICSYVLLFTNQASAQLHSPNLPQNRNRELAEEQLLQELYPSAALSAGLYLNEYQPAAGNHSYSATEKAQYILASAKLQNNSSDAATFAEAFIKNTANPAYKQRIAYGLAQNYFRKNRYNDALPYYEMAGYANLDNQEIIQAKFELAYCYFSNSQFNQAEPLLASVRELGGKYYDAGNYYYGLLAYHKNNYNDALVSFKRIDNKPEYSNLVPYYIAEIYYFTGNKTKALQEALRLIRRPEKSFYHNELHLLAAQVYFENKEYEEALPYFEYYYDHTDRIRKEDLYEMAYCYYKQGDWDNAIDNFQQLGETRDSLAQSSMYLLGECYINKGDKKSARNAFSICADMPYNVGQKEASMLLAAQLSYESGFFSDAIYYVNILLAEFPESKHADEAKTLLSDLLIRTRNYAEAYNTLQDVTHKDEAYSRVSQKVGYGYAMQQIQAANYTFADSLLDMSLAQSADPTYQLAATFWKADIAYALKQYKSTLTYGEQFVKGGRGAQWVKELSPEATQRNMYINMGYAAMELGEYKSAEDYFTKARFNADITDSAFIIATTLRQADAVFMQKDYKSALELYDRVIAAGSPETEYAIYQEAIIAGLSGKNKTKTELLSELINKPGSKYASEARYELGLTFIEEDKYSSAINTLLPLTNAGGTRNIAPKAWMKIGFAYQQSGKPDKAIDAYKNIVAEYPSSEERPAAMDALKSLYIQIGKPDRYAKLLEDNNLGGNEENQLDSTYYATAENRYAAGEWKEAIKLLDEYISKYPNGVFLVKANYYKAESHYQLKDYKAALKGYEAVLENNWSDFSENSARKAATIEYQQDNLKQAAKYYAQLRNMAMSKENLQTAYDGLMRCSYRMKDNDNAAAFADTLLGMPDVSEELMNNARLIRANTLLAAGNNDAALPLFTKLTSSPIANIAAEARYNIANIHYLEGNMERAEAAANITIKQSQGNEFWLVKSYILLSDILVQQKDYFNAKATLQSIVKNCKIPALKKEASEKLEVVKKLESQKSKLSE